MKISELFNIEPSQELPQLAKTIVDRRLGIATVFMLEALKPMSVLAHQSLMVGSPIAKMAGLGGLVGNLCQVFESRQQMENLALEIEKLLEGTPCD